MMTDPIADLLSRIRNASLVRKGEVVLPYSNIKFAIAKILERYGFVGAAEKIDHGMGDIRIRLKYGPDKEPAIRVLNRVSRPGCRIYHGWRDLPRKDPSRLIILSTSQGVMTAMEARKRRLGGEMICEVL